MKSLRSISLIIASLTVVAVSAFAQEARYDHVRSPPFSENRPTPETAKILSDEFLFHRATQTYVLGAATDQQ